MKGLITSSGLKAIRSWENVKKANFTITEVSFKDISNNIEEFEDVPYEGYVRKRSKHIHTDNYFCLARQLAKCIMSN